MNFKAISTINSLRWKASIEAETLHYITFSVADYYGTKRPANVKFKKRDDNKYYSEQYNLIVLPN